MLWKVLAVAGPVLLVGAVVALVALVGVAVGLRTWFAMRRARALLAAASAPAPSDPAPSPPPVVYPPVEWWASGAYGLWTGGEDCATWSTQRARESLESWYGATDAASLDRTIDGLVSGATGNAAWDQVRAVDLLRIGIAAGFVDRDQCAARVPIIARSLRPQYPSWEALAAGFEAGMNAWHDSRGVTDEAARGRVQRSLVTMRRDVWPKIAYDATL